MGIKNRFSLETEEEQVFGEGENVGEEEFAPSQKSYTADEAPEEDSDYMSEEVFQRDQEELVDFLKFPKNKRTLTDFLENTYKKLEHESVDRAINRNLYEHDSEMQGATPYHKPGHIGPLMYQYLNMVGVESAFASGLQHTKSSMTKTVQQRVDEINTLLRGVGGFNRQIKASFSRSAVVYLEQEDPRNAHRERVVFTINLADFELRYPLDESADDQHVEDGRSLRRLVWDEAVNTLSEIISNTGMKPKYVKNDKNSCILTMRQYLQSATSNLPDEYFSFDLRHVNEDHRVKLLDEYTKKIDSYDIKVEKLKKKIGSWFSTEKGRARMKEEIRILECDRDFYRATTADPAEMDTGIVFSIFVNTMKDYTLTKDKMQVIMTKFILALSNIAVDKSMDQQVNQVYQQKQAKATSVQDLGEKLKIQAQPQKSVTRISKPAMKRRAG